MIRIENEWRYFDETLNMPYPWYTRTCLLWLEYLDLKEKWIWEYGAGDSTMWYRAKGAHAFGVDSDYEYHRKYNVHWGDNQQRYVEIIKIVDILYDIIIIDGDYRDQCTEHALGKLKPGGYLIIDNFEQPSVEIDWTKTKELIKDMDQVLFKEPEHKDWQTLVVKK
jgi:hypothetical protein